MLVILPTCINETNYGAVIQVMSQKNRSHDNYWLCFFGFFVFMFLWVTLHVFMDGCCYFHCVFIGACTLHLFFESPCLFYTLYLFFSVIDRKFLKWPKKLSHFGQNVWKYRLQNTVMVSFNTTVRQMTKMFQRKKTSLVPQKWLEYSRLTSIFTLYFMIVRMCIVQGLKNGRNTYHLSMSFRE